MASRVLSRRRLLPFVQRMNDRYDAGWVHKDICERLERFSDDVAAGKSPRLMLLLPPRHGKLMADDTPVPTPTGWRRHGDLKPGDEVFGADGAPANVLAISPKRPADVRVELGDGSVFYTHENHEWYLYERGSREWSVRETSWLMRGVRGPRRLLSGNRSVYQLPVAPALQYRGRLEPGQLHPYALGAWLGDGSCSKPCITHGADKQPIIEKMRALGYSPSAVCTHSTTGVDTTYFAGTLNRPGRLTQELQALGVYHEKRIPVAYQVMTQDLRLELLAGLIDTDGHAEPGGRVRYVSAREHLARDVFELARGLGFRPYIMEAEPTMSTSGIRGQQVIWTVGFQPTLPIPTTVPHKQIKRLAPQRRTGFVDVRHDSQGKVGHCIQVDRADGLYIVGENLTVTHNSELASRNFPAWHLGRHPDHEFIACSYNLALAMTFSRKVKQLITDPAYENVFQTRLDPNNSSSEEWAIAGARGGYIAAGIGGGITGRGAHILVIDDPVRSAEDADSADTREKVWDWYMSTAYTRLAPGGGVLCIQTWWHDSDLAGKLQEMMARASVEDDEDADQFEVVKYPAIAEHDEYLDPSTHAIVYDTPPANARLLRSKGEALHPSRYDLKKLNKIRALNRKSDGNDGRWWSALYQQNPVPDDGSYFTKEQFRRGSHPHVARTNVYIAWDFAISEKKQNDYTVGSVGLQDENDMLHVAEVVRFKSGNAFFIVESICDLISKWYSPRLLLGFEDGQIYRAIKALLEKRLKERKLYPAIEVLQPITDKMARARTLQGRMQQGMVSFNAVGEWYDVVRAEMLRFPAGVHDDCVDSLAWMTQLAHSRTPPPRPKVQTVKSWRDKLKGIESVGVSHMAA